PGAEIGNIFLRVNGAGVGQDLSVPPSPVQLFRNNIHAVPILLSLQSNMVRDGVYVNRLAQFPGQVTGAVRTENDIQGNDILSLQIRFCGKGNSFSMAIIARPYGKSNDMQENFHKNVYL